MAVEGRKVVICMDGSSLAENAFQWYVDNVAKPTDQACILSVIEPAHAPNLFSKSSWEECSQKHTQALKANEDLRGTYEERLRKSNIPHSSHVVVHAKPGEAICEFCEKPETKAELIVMGCRGLGTLARTVLGSVSNYVVHHSNCPISIVPAPGKK